MGLFCSLEPLPDKIYDAADNLNRRHHTTVIIAGQQWDEAVAEGLGFDALLQYLVWNARAKGVTRAPSVRKIRDALNDASDVRARVTSALRAASVNFLRRHRLPRHEQIYVERTLDSDVAEMIAALTPGRLRQSKKTVERDGTTFDRARVVPPQIAVVRDLSGAGKTTFAVQLAEPCEKYFCAARAALEPAMDSLGDHLGAIGKNYGLSQLLQLNRPVVYVVDSLDESLAMPQKHTEFRALLRLRDELNQVARAAGLLCFPVLIVLTVREDYWREWESQLEGSNARQLTKQFSYFTESDFKIALDRYQTAYGFSLQGELRDDLREALTHPFTLQIYAEANEYAGAIDATAHIGHKVLSLYFERKKQDILKRPIAGFNGEAMMRICAAIAADTIVRTTPNVTLESLGKLIRETEPALASQWSEIARSLQSEQILMLSDSESRELRFRHSRFLEFMIAYHIRSKLREGESADFIDELHTAIASTSFASPFLILDNLKALTSDYQPEADMVEALFSRSRPFMSSLVQRIRSDIGYGHPPRPEDLRKVQIAMADRNPKLCWEGFFALAAAGSQQPPPVVLEAFCLAWDANIDRPDVWRLLQKLGRHELLQKEDVVRRVSKTQIPLNWLVYIDEVSRFGPIKFAETWRQFDGARLEARMQNSDDEEWRHVIYLLSFIKSGLPIPLG
ncbi:hypothetical protein [Sphingomonas faeni]|uniref:hypothetical protein n=1 Tax=Sphingomonas faeni TaxID=185950 RepID=UPI003353A594